uniref:acylglycerol lipase n=1 Tax=Latimeria chalumnae TaxID=7897 RepID=H3AYV4_LATCH|nr:PREDICTED: monoacylglycerol lipase ABHD6 [Latimeria chalumnae]|eukprot:XP_014344972.1 PREDICTED: monoacylglycerol lipase ABHD6 [Latimeria chalumnae]
MDLDIMNMFVIAGGTLAIPILAFFASLYLWPAALIRVYYWYWRRALGLQVRYASQGNYRFCYSCRGKPGNKPSILMLHGFSAHKDMWLSIAKFLPKNLHLICIDMPGHEGTTRTCADDYSIDGQVKRIHQFVESVKLNRKPFHLVGTSMGGHVAGVYAARFSSDVHSLTLICPAGLEYPNESKFVKQLRELEKTQDVYSIPLIPSTPEEMEDMLKLCSYVRFKIPQQILQGLVDVRIPHNDFYRELFLEIVGEKSRHTLQENMHKISVPTQVIWGKQDQVNLPSFFIVFMKFHP